MKLKPPSARRSPATTTEQPEAQIAKKYVPLIAKKPRPPVALKPVTRRVQLESAANSPVSCILFLTVCLSNLKA